MKEPKITRAARAKMLAWFDTTTYNQCDKSPEGRLAQAVLSQAVMDVTGYITKKAKADKHGKKVSNEVEIAFNAAKDFINPRVTLFGVWCDTACLDRDWVYEKAVKQFHIAVRVA